MLRGLGYIRGDLADYVVVRRADATAEDVDSALSGARAWEELQQARSTIAGDEVSLRGLVYRVLDEVLGRGVPFDVSALDTGEWLSLLEEAVLLRRVLLVRVARPTDTGGEDEEDEPDRDDSEVTSKTWIEIELFDEEGRPCADEPYEIDIGGGNRRSGSLDANGFAREDNLDPGVVRVSFPHRDRGEWRRG
jgi:hypothetical protein